MWPQKCVAVSLHRRVPLEASKMGLSLIRISLQLPSFSFSRVERFSHIVSSISIEREVDFILTTFPSPRLSHLDPPRYCDQLTSEMKANKLAK